MHVLSPNDQNMGAVTDTVILLESSLLATCGLDSYHCLSKFAYLGNEDTPATLTSPGPGGLSYLIPKECATHLTGG